MKRTINTILLLCVLIFTITMLGGCGNTKVGVSETQTDFSIVDEQGKVVKYLTADNTDVVKIKGVTEGYFKAMDDRSYETVKGDEEYSFYTNGLVENMKEKNNQVNTVKYYKDNMLVVADAGIDKFTAKFNADETICTVTVTSKLKVTSATEAYYKSLNATKDDTIASDFTLEFVKQSGVWKINGGSSSGASVLE